MATQKRVEVLPEELLIRTSNLDQGSWNYRGLLGWISRSRVRLAAELLTEDAVGRLLEVGYGSGVFMPAWVTKAGERYGVDVHERAEEIERVLNIHGTPASLSVGSVTQLPYPDGMFDRVVVISVLEFVDDLDRATQELRRVLQPGGQLVVVSPGNGKILDAGLKLLTGERGEDTFQGRRQKVMPALRGLFSVKRTLTFPRFAPRGLRLYTATLLQ